MGDSAHFLGVHLELAALLGDQHAWQTRRVQRRVDLLTQRQALAVLRARLALISRLFGTRSADDAVLAAAKLVRRPLVHSVVGVTVLSVCLA